MRENFLNEGAFILRQMEDEGNEPMILFGDMG